MFKYRRLLQDRFFVLFVVVPLMLNSIIAFGAFYYNPNEFNGQVVKCYLIVTMGLLAAGLAFVGFIVDDISPKRTLFSLITQGVALIFIFAGVYRGYGLIYGGVMQSLLDDWSSALYFSIVTWTTLGYGDFSPPPELRLIAAFQALVGYLFLGISVGLGTVLLSEKRADAANKAATS